MKHIIWSLSLRAAKPFYPDAQRLRLINFQDLFRRQRSKIEVAEGLIRKDNLGPRVKLGKENLVTSEKQIAACLYSKTIHPVFFAEALHTIGTKARELDPCVKEVQLANLGRESLGRALARGAVQESDLGTNFVLFSKKTIYERLEILAKLGVIVLKDEAALPTRPEQKPVASPQRPAYLHITTVRPNQLQRTVPAQKPEPLLEENGQLRISFYR